MAQLHEFQAKNILAAHGIQIPAGKMVTSIDAGYEIAGKLGGEVVIKAQIHSTSRAAAGGVKFANDPAGARTILASMLGSEIAGNRVDAVLVDEKLAIEREFYLGYIIDDRAKRPTLLYSDAGGSGIEERADSMRRFVCSVREGPSVETIRSELIGDDANIHSRQLAEIAQKLYFVARDCEARTAEINPLALLRDGRLVAVDARISVDDYAVFRHPELEIDMARELGHTPTKLERIAWEIERDDFRGTFYFVEIFGGVAADSFKIGFHGAGGGGSMASLDAAQRNGLHPACYVDTSGNPPASKVYCATKIILAIPGIEGYFLSGSGVASQEQFSIARAVLKAFLEVQPDIPAVLRLGGNGEDIAQELVKNYSARLPATIEAYRKRDSADFCAGRLQELIVVSRLKRGQSSGLEITHRDGIQDFKNTASPVIYSFSTRTGTISFDHSQLNSESSRAIVEACPQKILELDDNGRPVLSISPEEAERGKCSECLACEFASLEMGLNAVQIKFPIDDLD